MDDRSNTIAMMVLAAGIVALGGSIVTAEIFHAERPEKMGYVVEGVEAEAGEAAKPLLPRSRSNSTSPAPIRRRASRSSRNAPPATMRTRAGRTRSARICGARWASRMAMSPASLIRMR
jgi:hypothetical protein